MTLDLNTASRHEAHHRLGLELDVEKAVDALFENARDHDASKIEDERDACLVAANVVRVVVEEIIERNTEAYVEAADKWDAEEADT